MATVPLSGTNIRLLSGIPFSNDYKHTRWFDTIDQQNAYFGAATVVHSIVEANFQLIEGKSFVAVNKSIDELWGTNYLMFQNAQYNGKWFYGFVTKLEYKQRNTTYVHFEIDVFQTWKFDMTFKPSYVVREHCKLWNVDGTPVINTVDEGLNYGSDYDVMGAEMYAPYGGVMFLVIVSKSTLHTETGYPSANYIVSTMNGTPQPLSFYVHPFDEFGQSPNFQNEGTPYTLSSIAGVLNNIYSLPNAVNNVVSMYITNHIGIHFDYNDVSDPTLIFNSGGSALTSLEVVDLNPSGTPIKTIYIQNAFDYTSTPLITRNKYGDYGSVKESKLLMYPYSLSILDDFKGNRTVIKNEYINGYYLEIEVVGSMGVSNKVAYIPKNYLTDNLSLSADKIHVAIESALIDNSAHDVSIITDMLAAYIQGNKNSLENQRNSIIFNGTTDAIGGVIGGIGAAMTGNAVGIASAATNVIKGAGNTVLSLQAMQAKQKDINNLPPQMAKMGSNTSFDYGNGYSGIWLITKMVKPEYRKKLEDFWGMYGYKVNEVKIPNFHTRQYWNYVQTMSCNITGNFNNEDLQELKSIFDNGITLWHTDDIGNYSLTNGVIA